MRQAPGGEFSNPATARDSMSSLRLSGPDRMKVGEIAVDVRAGPTAES